MEEQHGETLNHTRKTLRETLAVDRTRLANERTFLAYLRTLATFLIAGISLIKLFSHFLIQTAGIFFLAAAVFIGIYGIIKYDSFRLHENDAKLISVPKLIWHMLGRVYSRLTLHGK